MHYWGSPLYKDNILRFFVILDPEKKLIDNPEIQSAAMFTVAVVVAKIKKFLMEHKKSIAGILGKVKRDQTKYYEVLSFKYHLSNETPLTVDEIEILAELLVKLTWTEEKLLKDTKVTNLLKRSIADSILGSFEKYDFWFMRYKDTAIEGYEKAKDMTMRDEDEGGGKGSGPGGRMQGTGGRKF